MLLGCVLLAVAVLDCDARAERFAEAVAHLPAAHWALVRSVQITDAASGGRAFRDGRIRIGEHADAETLWHEVGHIVSYQHGGAMIGAWHRKFWPKGEAKYTLPSGYAGTNAREDLADSYKRMIRGDLGECCRERARWLHMRLTDHD